MSQFPAGAAWRVKRAPAREPGPVLVSRRCYRALLLAVRRQSGRGRGVCRRRHCRRRSGGRRPLRRRWRPRFIGSRIDCRLFCVCQAGNAKARGCANLTPPQFLCCRPGNGCHARLAAARFSLFIPSSGAPCHGLPQGSEIHAGCLKWGDYSRDLHGQRQSHGAPRGPRRWRLFL